ncbi:MAG: hypothetical protein AAB906_00600 [Patescibacteria group bacterium]
MDIFSHGLWAGIVAKAANESSDSANKIKKPVRVWRMVFWGVFPDLFAFSLPFVWMFWNIIFGGLKFSDFPRPEAVEPAARDTLPVFQLASYLYNISHSLIIFIAVFAVVWLIWRRPIWEMSGWLLHVLIDIPTHSYRFYPTPFLWPLSEWKFNGFSWGTPWFIILNYSAIILVYWILRRKKNKKML